MITQRLEDVLLPGISIERIRAAYGAALSNELESGKFVHPESSACLAANTLANVLTRPVRCPRAFVAGRRNDHADLIASLAKLNGH